MCATVGLLCMAHREARTADQPGAGRDARDGQGHEPGSGPGPATPQARDGSQVGSPAYAGTR